MTRYLTIAALGAALLIPLSACSPDKAPEAAAPAFTQEDADFGLRLALLEGHLMIGRELMEDGQGKNAMPHFGHPIHELYGDLRPVIEARGAPQFESNLVSLERMAAAGAPAAEFNPAYDELMTKVLAARETIPAATRQSDDYTVHLIADIATTAAAEYRNALVAGKIGSLVEYHDARGFIQYAQHLLGERAAAADPRIGQASGEIDELMAFVAPLNPPDPPAATDVEFEAGAASLRDIAAGKAP